MEENVRGKLYGLLYSEITPPLSIIFFDKFLLFDSFIFLVSQLNSCFLTRAFPDPSPTPNLNKILPRCVFKVSHSFLKYPYLPQLYLYSFFFYIAFYGIISLTSVSHTAQAKKGVECMIGLDSRSKNGICFKNFFQALG